MTGWIGRQDAKSVKTTQIGIDLDKIPAQFRHTQIFNQEPDFRGPPWGVDYAFYGPLVDLVIKQPVTQALVRTTRTDLVEDPHALPRDLYRQRGAENAAERFPVIHVEHHRTTREVVSEPPTVGVDRA
jgi:hypothetical protein